MILGSPFRMSLTAIVLPTAQIPFASWAWRSSAWPAFAAGFSPAEEIRWQSHLIATRGLSFRAQAALLQGWPSACRPDLQPEVVCVVGQFCSTCHLTGHAQLTRIIWARGTAERHGAPRRS